MQINFKNRPNSPDRRLPCYKAIKTLCLNKVDHLVLDNTYQHSENIYSSIIVFTQNLKVTSAYFEKCESCLRKKFHRAL